MAKFSSVFSLLLTASIVVSLCLYYSSLYQPGWINTISQAHTYTNTSIANKNQTWEAWGLLARLVEPLLGKLGGEVNHEVSGEMKTILLWNNFFGNAYDHLFPAGGTVRNLTCKRTCLLSRNRSHPEEYDALIFHLRNAQNPPKVRRPQQVYAAFVMESQIHQGGYYIRGGDFYNWSVSLLRESTVPFNYRYVVKGPAAVSVDQLTQVGTNRTGARTAWVVSNCSPRHARMSYIRELRVHLPVDMYGRCGRPCPVPRNNHLGCYQRLAASGQYKFYLAFENSVCKDYISEKAFLALQVGLVPVVFGGLSSQDYQQGNFPPNSYIDVRNFTSPRELAKYLNYLDGDDQAYLEYHAWRKDYHITKIDPVCGVCDALYKNISPRNVNWGEFYNKQKQCDPHFGFHGKT